MKKLLLLLPIIILCLSCTKEPLDNPVEKISFSFDYDFSVSSGNITAKSGSAYTDFYNEFVVTKILTPRTYQLTFKNTTTNALTFMNGRWGVDTKMTLQPGTYNINGKSWPVGRSVCGDTCNLSFNENVVIDANTSNITLNPKYDCSLILMEPLDIVRVEFSQSEAGGNTFRDLPFRSGKYYHLFVLCRTLFDESVTNGFNSLAIYKINGYSVNIILYYNDWGTGKYYYLKPVNDSYTLAEMVSGN